MIEAFQARAFLILDAVDEDLRASSPDINDFDFDWPEPAEGDEDDDPLFDSTRDYFEQNDRYRVHQGTPEDAEFTTYQLVCEACGETFESRRPQATTCSKICRARKYRQGKTYRENQKAASPKTTASRQRKVSRAKPKPKPRKTSKSRKK
jgi:hypothetical protein